LNTLGGMSDVTIGPFTRPFKAAVTPPGSKSLTNRALVMAALADGQSTLRNVLFADDTAVMLDGLRRLGFGVEVDRGAKAVRVRGEGGAIPASSAELFCGNSGTTIRFLTAMCSLGRGWFRLDGVPRMRQRPIGELVEVLKNLGVRIKYLGGEGFPPIEVLADGLPGGILRYGEAQSSQYLSAVLMASPYAKHEVRVDLEGRQTSWPYVAMTMQLMDSFGVLVEVLREKLTGRPQAIVVPQEKYRAADYAVEPDASGAGYFLALAALHEGSKVTIEGLGKRSLQGDVGFADVLHRMGADLIFGGDFVTMMGTGKLEGIDVDLLGMPDMAQTLAVVALFADGPTTMRGVHTLRVKETDRVAALANELGKLGAEVEVGDDGDVMTITPPEGGVRPAAIDTYDDHRMAMSFALAGTKSAGVTIRAAECVNKTYPEFFADLERVRRGGGA